MSKRKNPRGYILWNTGRQPQQKVLAVVQTRTRTGYFCLCLPLPLNSSFFYSVPFFSLSLFFCLISPWQSPVVLSLCLLDPFSYCPFTVSVTVLRSNLSSKPGTCIRQVINCTKKTKKWLNSECQFWKKFQGWTSYKNNYSLCNPIPKPKCSTLRDTQ